MACIGAVFIIVDREMIVFSEYLEGYVRKNGVCMITKSGIGFWVDALKRICICLRASEPVMLGVRKSAKNIQKIHKTRLCADGTLTLRQL